MPDNRVNVIYKYFPQLTQLQKTQFAELEALYSDWNRKINVVSRKDIDELYLRHVLHSLGIAKVKTFESNSKVIDVGTGGGFPGIPLAILFPEVEFLLVDSIGKKIKVVEEVITSMQLKNVTTRQTRVEELNARFDYVVSRAVARFISFYDWVHTKINNGGSIYYLKGGDITEEMAELNRPFKEYLLNTYFDEPYFDTKKVVEVPC